MKKLMLIGVLSMALQACAWVALTPEGEKVRVLDADEVTSCRELGTTTSMLRDSVAGVRRSEGKVREELRMLARNAAVDMGGDTIVPVGEPDGGRQVFAVYRCVNP